LNFRKKENTEKEGEKKRFYLERREREVEEGERE
jgi:hypothetical protein